MDTTGFYYGDLENNYPHGFGKKIYGDIEYQGFWSHGSKHGEGELKIGYKIYEVEYCNGTIQKVLRYSPIEQGFQIHEFPENFQTAKIDDHYEEFITYQHESKKLYFYTHDSYIYFEGKLLEKPIKNEYNITYGNDKIVYLGEGDAKNDFTGYCEVKWKHYVYIGNAKSFLPNGQGKLKFSNGKVLISNFVRGSMNGQGTILMDNCKIESYFNNYVPSSEIKLSFEDITCTLRSVIDSTCVENFRIKNKLIENKTKIQRYITKIKTFLNEGLNLGHFYILEYISSQKRISAHSFQYSCNYNIQSNFVIDFKTWSEFEESMLKIKSSVLSIQRENNKYIGEGQGFKAEGKGKVVFNNGECYKGNFKNNTFHGLGDYNYLNGSVYKGEFKNGLREGMGIFIFPDKSRFKGHFKNDMIHGPGYYITKAYTIEGKWEKNNFVAGKYISKDSIRFILNS